MMSISSDAFERIHRAIFSVQRLKGIAHVVSAWMANGAMSAWEGGAVSLPDCEAAALAYFEARPEQAALLDEYRAALQVVGQLDDAVAGFLAQGAQGDPAALLERAGTALEAFAGVLGRLPDYPGAADDARALRGEAGRCLALRQPA
ncbi:MAG TPA: hypothetical protein VF800_03060 [Telluria sp.]|jgi:hypothetical protein